MTSPYVSPARRMRITNMVSISKLSASTPNEDLPLEILCKAIHGKFSHKVFPAVVSRLRELQVTLSWFATRRVVCTGARTREDSIMAHLMAANQASKHLNRHYAATGICITNIVTSAALGYRLDMEEIDNHFSKNGSTWRPIVFSGMKVTHTFDIDSKSYTVSFIVFANGNINVTGLQHESHIDQVEREMHTIFSPFQLEQEEEMKIRTPPRTPLYQNTITSKRTRL